jgi:hypothetical protein
MHGFYAMQALSSCTSTPNITRYHRQPEPALKWMKAMSKKKLYDGFVMGFFECPWEVFNSNGKKIGTRTSITPDSGAMRESLVPVVLDYPAFDQSAQAVLGDSVRCITFAQHHAYASSVGHSNMVAIALLMVMGASNKDLEHVYSVDSIASGCRVQGWFMDTSAVSEPLMDKYLDLYKWLSKCWPIDSDHHLKVLSYRMATLWPKKVLGLLVAVHEHLGEDISLVAKRVHDAPVENLIMFTTKMLEGLESAMVITGPQNIELFDFDALVMHAKRIAALYRETFLQ